MKEYNNRPQGNIIYVAHTTLELLKPEQKLARNVLFAIFEDEVKEHNRWCRKHIEEVICPIAGIDFNKFCNVFDKFKIKLINGDNPLILLNAIKLNFLNIAKHNSTNGSDIRKIKPRGIQAKKLKKTKN